MIEEAHLQAAVCDLVAEVVSSAGAADLKVTGASMLPVIQAGDVLRIRRHLPDELELGKIILYHRSGRLIAHRILRISGEYLFTRGDSLPSLDPPVRRGEVIGLVENIFRNGQAVDTRRTIWQRGMASILRWSEICTKAYLRVSARGPRFTASH